MAEEKEFLKPQSPIQDGDAYILPITSFDQIIMPDGISRWDGVSGSEARVTVNGVKPDSKGEITIEASDVGARPDDWCPAISDIDGLEYAINNAGSVKTVCSVNPDQDGNVKLNASDIGAMPFDAQIDAKTFNGLTLEELKSAIMAEAVYQ